MFITALSVLKVSGRKPEHSSIGKQVNKLLYIHTREYYSTIKSSELLIHTTIRINHNVITLTERNLVKKYNVWFYFYEILENAKSI